MAILPNKEKLVYNFNYCSNWEEKYLYIIELGKKLSNNSKNLHHPKNLIKGCQSQVWINMTYHKENKSIVFEGDSDAAIVKGLVAIVFILYNGLDVKEIIDFDISNWFYQLELIHYLTPSRSQGLEAIVRTIRQNAYLFI